MDTALTGGQVTREGVAARHLSTSTELLVRDGTVATCGSRGAGVASFSSYLFSMEPRAAPCTHLKHASVRLRGYVRLYAAVYTTQNPCRVQRRFDQGRRGEHVHARRRSI